MTEETVQAYVHSLPASIFGLAVCKTIHCTKLDKGLHHLNFKLVVSDGNKTCAAVLRLPATAEDKTGLIHEAWYLKKLDSSVVPRVLYHADSSALGVPVLISAFAAGNHIAFDKLNDTQIALLAQKLAKVHSIQDSRYSLGPAALPTATGTYADYARSAVVEEIIKPYERAKSIPHDATTVLHARNLLEQKLGGADESWDQNMFSLCHGDVGIYNVLWTNNDLRLIDWDGVRFGDPADDIAYTFAINHVSAHWQHVFLETYIRASARKDIPRRIETFLLKNYLFDVVWAIGKLFEEQEDRSLIKLAQGEYRAMYEERLAALRSYNS